MSVVTSLLIVFYVIEAMECKQREMGLMKTTGAHCKTLSIGYPWTSPSSLACYVTCLSRYPDTCQSVVYNEKTKSCTPGTTAFGPIDTLFSAIPDANADDVILFLKQAVPSCNSIGFAVYDVCGTSACLHLSTYGVRYADAVAECSRMNSTLFVGDTEARFALFWYTSLLHLNVNTWLGLDDLVSEGQFVWTDGNSLSSWQYSYIWALPDQPDNHLGMEDCCEAKHHTWPGKFGINDVEYYHNNYFICELLK